jgi:hypothetical protein
MSRSVNFQKVHFLLVGGIYIKISDVVLLLQACCGVTRM